MFLIEKGRFYLAKHKYNVEDCFCSLKKNQPKTECQLDKMVSASIINKGWSTSSLHWSAFIHLTTVFLIPRQNSYCAVELSQTHRVYDSGDGRPSWSQECEVFLWRRCGEGRWHFLSGSDRGVNEVQPQSGLLSSVFPSDRSTKKHSSAMIQRTKVTESPPN